MQKMSMVVEVQRNIFKTYVDKKILSWKWPKANPNINFKLIPGVRVGVNSWENDKRWDSETKCKRWVWS